MSYHFLKKPFKEAKGQTAIEYVLLLAVLSVIITTVLGRVKEYIFADENNCTPESTSIVCSFQNSLRQDGTDFKYFTIRR